MLMGLFNLRQLHFALFDMTLHTSEGSTDVKKVWNETREDISLMQQGSETTYGYASFGHIGGYDAGYYGYLWVAGQCSGYVLYKVPCYADDYDRWVVVQRHDSETRRSII
ncbi:hypothetical protein V1520DRAFT_349453 [Lipomyces starkeyi]